MPVLQSSRQSFGDRVHSGNVDLTPVVILANARRADLLDEVVLSRLASHARRSTHVAIRAMPWRYRLGLRLVRLGAWVQGASEVVPLSGAGRRSDFA